MADVSTFGHKVNNFFLKMLNFSNLVHIAITALSFKKVLFFQKT